MEVDGTPMTVREALFAINRVLDETLEGGESDLDSDTLWAVTWYSENGHEPGEYGRAEQLSKARNTSVSGLVQAGIVGAGGGEVRLLARDELDADWDPATDKRLTVWEVVQHLLLRLREGGEHAAAELLRAAPHQAEPARELAYRLYHICERQGRAADALAYNGLIASWLELSRLAAKPPSEQTAFTLTG